MASRRVSTTLLLALAPLSVLGYGAYTYENTMCTGSVPLKVQADGSCTAVSATSSYTLSCASATEGSAHNVTWYGSGDCSGVATGTAMNSGSMCTAAGAFSFRARCDLHPISAPISTAIAITSGPSSSGAPCDTVRECTGDGACCFASGGSVRVKCVTAESDSLWTAQFYADRFDCSSSPVEFAGFDTTCSQDVLSNGISVDCSGAALPVDQTIPFISTWQLEGGCSCTDECCREDLRITRDSATQMTMTPSGHLIAPSTFMGTCPTAVSAVTLTVDTSARSATGSGNTVTLSADNSTISVVTSACSNTYTRKTGCFSSASSVRLVDGSEIPFSKLSVGDRVFSIDASGKPFFDTVFRVTHHDDSEVGTFLRITTENDNVLHVTANHYLHSGSCCDLSQLSLAGDLQVGDVVYTATPEGLTQPSKIASIETVTSSGVYNVHTLSGNIVVDNIAASHFTTASTWTATHRHLATYWYHAVHAVSSLLD